MDIEYHIFMVVRSKLAKEIARLQKLAEQFRTIDVLHS